MATTCLSRKISDFSFIIPTYNSEATLALVLNSIRDQRYSQDFIEILVIDGGSQDATLKIAASYKARIFENIRVLPEYAKAIGLEKASGRYLIFHDSDEVLTNRDSLLLRKLIFDTYPQVNSIACSGYLAPKGYPGWSDYTNIVGDPFSRFLYNGGGGDAWDALPKYYRHLFVSHQYIILEKKPNDPPPLFDACSHTVRASRVRTLFPEGIASENLSEVIPKLIIESGQFAVMIGDYIIHYSSSTFIQILRKIRFRVINNLSAPRGSSAGFANRQHLLPNRMRIKKLLYIPYALSIIFPVIDGTRLAIRWRRIEFLMHPIFSISVVAFIIWYGILYAFGRDIRAKTYG